MDAWFNEKYNPEMLDLYEREKKDLTKKNYSDFVGKLHGGLYDGLELRVKEAVGFKINLEFHRHCV
jgi:hypothetical protein